VLLEIHPGVERDRAVAGRSVDSSERRRVDVRVDRGLSWRTHPLRLVQQVDQIRSKSERGSLRDMEDFVGGGH